MAKSNAERQREYRLRKASQLPVTVIEAGGAIIETDGRGAILRAQRGRIAELEDEVKYLKQLLAQRAEPHPFGHPSPAPKPSRAAVRGRR